MKTITLPLPMIVALLLISVFFYSCSQPRTQIDSNYIHLDSLEKRVFEEYGEGDAGVEQMLYLKTGIHQDFMGTPRDGGKVLDFDYGVNLSDRGTIIYDKYGKFVDFVEVDANSPWDKAISKQCKCDSI